MKNLRDKSSNLKDSVLSILLVVMPTIIHGVARRRLGLFRKSQQVITFSFGMLNGVASITALTLFVKMR